MEIKKIKEVNLSVVDNQIIIQLENPNYIQYNFDAIYNDDTIEDYLMVLFAKTFQNFHTYTFGTVSPIEFKLTVNDIEYKILYKNHNIICDSFHISRKQTVSSINILKSILEDVFRQEVLLKITKDIEEKTKKFKGIFEYKYEYSNYEYSGYSVLEYHYVVRYIPNGRYIVVKYSAGKFEFVSYLEFEGEIYHHGHEKISEKDIENKIEYWTKILNDIPTIKEELTKI